MYKSTVFSHIWRNQSSVYNFCPKMGLFSCLLKFASLVVKFTDFHKKNRKKYQKLPKNACIWIFGKMYKCTVFSHIWRNQSSAHNFGPKMGLFSCLLKFASEVVKLTDFPKKKLKNVQKRSKNALICISAYI